jgi:NADH-quinone oxidoreductase subunit G/NADP-reducing hydrogenase subunit HndD
MVNLTINNQKIVAEEGLTILEAAKQNGIHIPSLCYMKDVHQMGACRICVVEVEGAKTLQASCITQIVEGMVVKTNTDRVRNARKVLYELMLSDHSQDCLTCTRNQSCEFQELGRLLGVDDSRFEGKRSPFHVDASAAITRDMTKCILCRRCVTVCNEIQKVGALNPQNRGFNTEISPAMSLPIGTVNCALCGQCTVVCPVGALKETSSAQKVWDAINDPTKRTVVQVAPAVRVALGEEFGLPAGSRVTGKMAAALRRMGFDDIFDTNFTADLTILEEGTEFLTRVKNALTGKGATLPMITSCSPGWIKFIEHNFADQLEHLSTCKSPHTMLGALVKSFYAEKIGVDPKDIYVVSVMPCTAKKFEIEREEMKNDGNKNVDAVITTRELGEMIKSAGIDFVKLPDEEFDNPLGMSSGAADIFGLTGGVMEAALRTVYELVTGRELPFDGLHVTPIVGLDQVKTATIRLTDTLPDYQFLEGVDVKVAVTSGLAGARQLMEEVEKGTSPYHFIEVMGCPGGCIMGGGQPRSDDPDVRQKRLSGLYTEDEAKTLRKSHENPFIQSLYADYLGKPNGHKSHELLHTHYVKRGKFNELTDENFVVEIDEFTKRRAAQALKQDVKVTAAAKLPEESLSPKIFELEAENRRLKNELQDTQETVDIMKSVLSKYAKQG